MMLTPISVLGENLGQARMSELKPAIKGFFFCTMSHELYGESHRWDTQRVSSSTLVVAMVSQWNARNKQNL